MTPQELELHICDLISKVSQGLGLDLVEVKIKMHKKDVLIEVLADRTHGGIGMEECSKLNRCIVEAIDKEGFFSEDGYSLEVASPGLDRPLTTAKDFLRNIDAQVRVLLKEKIAGKGEYVGVVKSVAENAVTLLTTKEQKEINVPIDQILKCLLVI